jgi:hypothetical protein
VAGVNVTGVEIGEDVAEVVARVDVVEPTRERDAEGSCGAMTTGF